MGGSAARGYSPDAVDSRDPAPDSPSDGNLPTWRKFAAARAVAYCTTFAIAILCAAVLLKPWAYSGSILGPSGDIFFQQAMSEVAGRAGMFAADPNLGSPGGTGFWSVPQLGIMLGFGAWLAIGHIGLDASVTVVWLTVLSAGTSALGCLYFLRSFRAGRAIALPIALAVSIGASPTFLGTMGHLNVAPWFAVPIAMAVGVRLAPKLTRGNLLPCAILCLAIALSPLWWAIASLFILVLLGFARLITGAVRRALILLLAGVALGCGLVVQIGFIQLVPQVSATTGRGAWDSNIYGGRLVDVLLSSPLLNREILRLSDLMPGNSTEFKPVGIVAGAMVAIALAVLLGSWAATRLVGGRFNHRLVTLSQLTTVITLLYLAGGFGNLQAGAAVLLGGESPARVWSRMLVVLALVGAAWFLIIVRKGMQSLRERTSVVDAKRYPLFALVAAVAVLTSWFIDTKSLPTTPSYTNTSLPESPAVAYLARNGNACPVMQLPVTNGIEPPRGKLLRGDNFYRGYIPYLIDSNIPWSYGSVSTEQLRELRAIPKILTPDAVAAISANGFCFVLFDKEVAAASNAAGASPRGTNISVLGAPVFDSPRFAVYEVPSLPNR